MSPAKKPASGVPGVKMLITAASLAATVGGWALLSTKESTSAQSVVIPSRPEPVPVLSIKLAPLPTLVPPPALPQLVIVGNRRAPSVKAQPAARAAPAAAAAPVVPALPPLREVSAPAPRGPSSSSAPAPVASTKSSR